MRNLAGVFANQDALLAEAYVHCGTRVPLWDSFLSSFPLKKIGSLVDRDHPGEGLLQVPVERLRDCHSGVGLQGNRY